MDIDAKTVIDHDCDVEVKGTLRIRVGASLLTIGRDGIAIETKGTLTLKASTLVLNGASNVELKGTQVRVNADAILTLKSGGLVHIN